MRAAHVLRAAAIGTWLVCGAPPIAAALRAGVFDAVFLTWLASFGVFGASLAMALVWRDRRPRRAVACVAAQSAAAIAVNALARPALDASGVSAGLFVLVAAQLPYFLGLHLAAAWVLVQSLASALLIVRFSGWADGLAFGAGLCGFQLFAFLTVDLMRREAAARNAATEANAELVATRALLAETSRSAERLRIARELHDSIGHHLTALSLELQVASRLPENQAHLQRAQMIARGLLGEVRNVVSEMREAGEPDLGLALRHLVATLPATPLQVELDVPDALAIDDAAKAHDLLRCVQELVTNTIKHARASRLSIQIQADDTSVRLRAADDGQGAGDFQPGHGLSGMRERFALHRGDLRFVTAPGAGFEVHGSLPRGAAAT